MKRIFSLLALVFLTPVLCACVGESSAQIVLPESKYVELNKGIVTESGKFTKKQTKVISSQEDYAAELANYTNNPPAQVDFSTGRVLLADMGGRNTGGYSISVTSVDVFNNWVVANIRLVKPGQGCIVTQALTNPYQFVFIPTLKEILVSESVEIANC